MPTEPHDSLKTTTIARKRQAPLNGNGDRIELPKRKQRIELKKSDTASAGNSKTIPTKSGPQKFTSSAKKRVPSVNIEEVVDIDIHVP